MIETLTVRIVNCRHIASCCHIWSHLKVAGCRHRTSWGQHLHVVGCCRQVSRIQHLRVAGCCRQARWGQHLRVADCCRQARWEQHFRVAGCCRQARWEQHFRVAGCRRQARWEQHFRVADCCRQVRWEQHFRVADCCHLPAENNTSGSPATVTGPAGKAVLSYGLSAIISASSTASISIIFHWECQSQSRWRQSTYPLHCWCPWWQPVRHMQRMRQPTVTFVLSVVH